MGHGTGIIQYDPNAIQRFPTSRAPYGRILWQADFDYSVEVDATVGTVSITTAEGEVIRGRGSLKLQTGAVAGNTAEIWKRIASSAIVGTKNASMAIELLFGGTNSNTSIIQMMIYNYNKNVSPLSGLKWTKSTKQWQYYDSAGNWQNIAGAVQTILATGSIGNYLKIILDLENKQYRKLRIGSYNYDLSGKDLYLLSGADYEVISVEISIETDAAAAATFTIDDMVVSDMEN